jgi:CO dehydrogenase/acetyl-CoA synthase gamma subunit (corrinoid Fe-S protein)
MKPQKKLDVLPILDKKYPIKNIAIHARILANNCIKAVCILTLFSSVLITQNTNRIIMVTLLQWQKIPRNATAFSIN